jgi:protein-S-isoprenylcysteine O-methyltransferase Ste14
MGFNHLNQKIMKRILIFLYGIIAYLVFLVAFLYAIGFVGNIIVPKSIDSGTPTESTTTAILINVVLMSIFALQHSIMARPAFKRWWTKIIPKAMERSTYVLLSSLALFLLYWQWKPLTANIWDVSDNQVLSGILNALFIVGWGIVLLATFMINHFDLFGLKQVYNNLKSIPPQQMTFKLTWLYSIVRHPIMLGFLIAFWSAPVMSAGHLLFAVVTTAYILVAVKFLEERDLLKEFGEQYKSYQNKVPMIIPYIKWRK